MRGLRQAVGAFACVVSLLAATAGHSAEPEQFFASVFLDNKKIGQFHVRVSRAQAGEIEELRARASVTMLGINLYEFTNDLTQTWRDGELQQLQGVADDNGKKYNLQLTRQATQYSGSVNTKPVTLPIKAFPNSIWHYGIVNQSLLFNEVDLQLLKVSTTVGPDTVEFNKQKIPAQRATIKGDFTATVWFDQGKEFVMAELQLSGRKVVVKRDP
jgi:Family of unknown function (DUF6134)